MWSVFTGDGLCGGHCFQTLSGAAERNEEFIYVCYENEGYNEYRYSKKVAQPPPVRHTSPTNPGVVLRKRLKKHTPR